MGNERAPFQNCSVSFFTDEMTQIPLKEYAVFVTGISALSVLLKKKGEREREGAGEEEEEFSLTYDFVQ